MEYAAPTSTWQDKFSESQLWPVLSFAGYNAVLLGILLFSDFNGHDLLAVIYLELCVIGLFALLRMITAMLFGAPFDSSIASVSRGSTILLGLLLSGFYVIKFGGLMLLLGALVIMLKTEEIGLRWADDMHPLVELCAWVLLIRYAVMFVWSTLVKGDYKDVSVVRLLLSPYLNGLWVIVTIAVGMYLALSFPDSPLLLFTLGVFAAKLVLDLFNLLLELRRTRLADVIEARRKRRAALARVVGLWAARVFVVGMAGGVVGLLVFAGHNIWSQSNLEDRLAAGGVVVAGTVHAKEMSPGSGNFSTSYSIDVRYQYADRTFTHPYWIRSNRWEELAEGDTIEVTVLPNDPCWSQLSEYVGTTLDGRGWFDLSRRGCGDMAP